MNPEGRGGQEPGVTRDLTQRRARQHRGRGIARRPRHRIGLGRLHGQRERRRDVGEQVDPQELDRRHRPWHSARERAQRHDDLAEIRGEQEAKRLPDVRVDGAALLDGGHDPREVVGEEHDVGDVAGDVGAAHAHGHADVGGAQRGRVVDPVAGHGDHLAVALQGPDDMVLVSRRHAGEHVHVAHEFLQPVGAHLADARAVEDVQRSPAQVELAIDRGRRACVVPGDEHGADPGAAARADGVGDPGTDRIREGDQTQPDQLVIAALVEGGNLADGQREDAQPAGRDLIVQLQQRPPRLRRQRLRGTVLEPAVAADDDLLGRALHRDQQAAVLVVHGRHPVVPLAAPTNVAQRMAPPRVAIVETGQARRAEQRALRRAAAAFGAVVAQRRLVAEDGDLQDPGEAGIGLTFRRELRPLTVLPAGDAPRIDGHAVLGQRSRLVGADHGDRAEALDRRQSAHQCAPPGHPLGAEGQRRRRHGRQPLGHGRHRERDGAARHLQQRHAAEQSQPEDGRAGAERHSHQPTSYPVELTLEGRRRRGRLRDQRADPAELGPSPRRRHDGRARALRDDRARVEHVDAVGERAVGRRQGRGHLRDRHAFTGQRRLVHGESRDVDHARVGGHVVTDLQDEDVAGNEARGRDHHLVTVASDERLGDGGVLQRHHDALDATLGDVADGGVGDHHGENDYGVDHGAARERQDGGAAQEQHR